jgi:hypothetical protein
MWDKCNGFALHGRWLGAIRLPMLYLRITDLRLLVPNSILIPQLQTKHAILYLLKSSASLDLFLPNEAVRPRTINFHSRYSFPPYFLSLI